MVSICLVQLLIVAGAYQAKDMNQGLPLPPGGTMEERPMRPFIRLPLGAFDPLSQAWSIDLPENLTIEDYPTEVAGYYLLQFKGPVLKEWKDAVIDASGQFFDYIPDFAFIAKMDKETKALVEAMKPVRWVGIYQPAFRISPDLMGALTKGIEQRQVDILITVFPGEPLGDLMEEIRGSGGNILDVSEGKWKSKISVRIEPRHLVQIAKMMGIKWIEKAPEFKLFRPLEKGGDK